MKIKFQGKVNNEGRLEIQEKDDFALYLATLANKKIEITVNKKMKKRTSRQNKALHLWFTLLANAMNEAGYDMRKVIRKEVNISWTSYNVKEYLWRPLMKALTGKKSTTQLKADEIDKIYDEINKAIGERTGISIPFPCVEQLINYDKN